MRVKIVRIFVFWLKLVPEAYRVADHKFAVKFTTIRIKYLNDDIFERSKAGLWTGYDWGRQEWTSQNRCYRNKRKMEFQGFMR